MDNIQTIKNKSVIEFKDMNVVLDNKQTRQFASNIIFDIEQYVKENQEAYNQFMENLKGN